MLDDETYKEWTKVFGEGRYEGSWEKGAKVHFIGIDPKTGEESGMFSQIEENKPYEFLSIKHLGIISNGVEDTTSEEAKKWAPAYENYTFKENGGVTEVLVDLEMADEYVEMFQKLWPAGLERLKEIAERS